MAASDTSKGQKLAKSMRFEGVTMPKALIKMLVELLKKLDVSCSGECDKCPLNEKLKIVKDYTICELLNEILNKISN